VTTYQLRYYSLSEAQANQYAIDRHTGWESLEITYLDDELSQGPKTLRLKTIGSRTIDNKSVEAPLLKIVLEKQSAYPYLPDGSDRVTADDSEEFKALSVFTTAMIAVQTFENKNAIGRPIPWHSPGALTVRYNIESKSEFPFYSRDDLEVKLFHIKGKSKYGKKYDVDTAFSPDIISHEVAHAVLDGLAPNLLDSNFVESLAIHESVADLTAFNAAMRNNDLRKHIMNEAKDDLRKAYDAIQIAEEAGRVSGIIDGHQSHFLRTLDNKMILGGVANNYSPHDVSQVLTGLIFDTICDEYSRYRSNDVDATSSYSWDASKAIWKGVNALYRALDYIPRSDITFADLLNALVITDLMYYPDERDRFFRESIGKNAEARGIDIEVPSIFPSFDGPQLFVSCDFSKGVEHQILHEQVEKIISVNLEYLQIKDDAEWGFMIYKSSKKSRVNGFKLSLTDILMKIYSHSPEGDTNGATFILEEAGTIKCLLRNQGASETTKLLTGEFNASAGCKSLYNLR